MSDRKYFKKALIGTMALLGCGLLLPASALAASCPSIIAGTALAGLDCAFDTVNSVTVDNGGEVGTISQISYAPASPSFILNNGTISNDLSNNAATGITIDGSTLTNGLTNNGVINTYLPAIFIDNTSTISGGISNTGSLISATEMTLQIDNGSTVNGNITNSGSIISNSINNPAMLLRNLSTVNGDIDNSGTMRTFGVGDGFLILDSTVNGDLINSGIMRGGSSGLTLLNFGNITGDITNSGTMMGDANNGLDIRNTSTVSGDVTNSGTISGGNYGVNMDASTVNGIINQAGATISGGVAGLFIDGSSSATGIHNYGTITGSTYGISIGNGSTVNIATYDGSVINGAIDAADSDLNYSGGQINGTISVNAFNINAGHVFDMNYAITAQDEVNNAGTLAFGTAARTITATNGYVQSAGGILKLGVQNTTTYGQITVDNTVDLSQSGAIDVDIANGASIAIGSVFANIISGGALVAPGGGYSVTDNSRLLNFTAATNGTGVDLTAVDDASTSIAQSAAATGNSRSAGAARELDEIMASSPTGDWQNVIGALGILSNDQEVANAVNQTIPALAGATADEIIKTMSAALRVLQDRQASETGISSGDRYLDNRNFWLKAAGSAGNQDGIAGYDSRSYGVIAGADNSITDDARIGVGVSYFNSRLDSADNDKEVNIDSYTGFVYSSYSLDDRSDINAQVALGYNSSDSERNIDFGGLNRTAEGSYNGWGLHAGAGIDRIVTAGNDTTITPEIRLDYFVVGNESYDESGAGVLNLHVDSQTQDQLIPAVEVKASHKFNPELSLTLNAGLGYDLLNDDNAVSAGFAGGGGTFITPGLETSPWIVRSGAGFIWKQSEGVAFTARYDREDRGSEQDNQTVSLKLHMPF